MSYYFPISEPMVGSVIPGLRQQIRVARLVTWPDYSNAFIRRRAPVDPVMKFPDMGEKHGSKHPLMQQLHSLLKGKGGPEMREGYSPFVGSRNWRNA